MSKLIHTITLSTMLALSLATSALGQDNQTPTTLPDNAGAKPGNQGAWIKDVPPVQQPKDPIVLESQQGKPSFVNPPTTCISMTMVQWNQLQSDIKALRDQMTDLKSKHDEMQKMMMDKMMAPPSNTIKIN